MADIVSGLFPDVAAQNQIVSACEFVPSEPTEGMPRTITHLTRSILPA